MSNHDRIAKTLEEQAADIHGVVLNSDGETIIFTPNGLISLDPSEGPEAIRIDPETGTVKVSQ